MRQNKKNTVLHLEINFIEVIVELFLLMIIDIFVIKDLTDTNELKNLYAI
jgi:hypothetical protein